MDKAIGRTAELVIRLSQQHRGVPAAHVIQPHYWSKDLPRAVLVVGDKRAVGRLFAGHHVRGTDIGLAIAGRLHDDRLHGPAQSLGLSCELLGEVERGLQAFVLEIPAVDQ